MSFSVQSGQHADRPTVGGRNCDSHAMVCGREAECLDLDFMCNLSLHVSAVCGVWNRSAVCVRLEHLECAGSS